MSTTYVKIYCLLCENSQEEQEGEDEEEDTDKFCNAKPLYFCNDILLAGGEEHRQQDSV